MRKVRFMILALLAAPIFIATACGGHCGHSVGTSGPAACAN
jgi:hypothetical protein